MNKKKLALMMEWLRPVGIGLVIFFAYYCGHDAIAQFLSFLDSRTNR